MDLKKKIGAGRQERVLLLKSSRNRADDFHFSDFFIPLVFVLNSGFFFLKTVSSLFKWEMGNFLIRSEGVLETVSLKTHFKSKILYYVSNADNSLF